MKDFKTVLMSINAPVTIFGHTFDGLADIRDYVEVSSSIGRRDSRCVWKQPFITSDTPEKSYPGMHVLEIYESYPCFDSSDYEYESRFYRNFIFSREPFTEKEVSRLALLRYGCNNELMPEDLPEKYVLIYYVGDGDTMKLTYRCN